MKAGSAILSKYISVEILPQEPPSPSFACYDEEVDISMIYANPKDNCYKKAVELHDYRDAPALMFEMNGEGKFIYLEFFHAPCIPTPELKWDDSRKILCCQVKFHKINKKFYRNVKAYTLPDYSLVR
ncbi:MAG: hypothetical protein LWY06_05295, partial [Firmicutes bacterium]|nr:hypothetical protein [Bacillota bacterium]